MDLSKIILRFKNKVGKRKGRGTGSGLGRTSGRGNKGEKARSGKKLPYIGFNGGNLPYLRKIPKRGFNAYNPVEYQIVNLDDIAARLKDNREITPADLKSVNLIKDEKKRIKILADTKAAYGLTAVIKADKFSMKAKEKIESAGGKTECLQR
jgi:large subunit ribosomal protein L15